MIRITVSAIVVFSLCFFISCKKTVNNFGSQVQNITKENALIEAAFDDVLKVSENILMKNADAKIGTTAAPLGCITDIDSVVTGPGSKTYTIHFPPCTSYDGKARLGYMYLYLTGTNYNSTGATLTVKFNDFYINGNQLSGKMIVTNLGAGVFEVVVSDEDGSGFAKMGITEFNKETRWKSTHKRIIYSGNGDNIILNNQYYICNYDSSIPTYEGFSTDGIHYQGDIVSDHLTLDYGCTASGNLRYPMDGIIHFKTPYGNRTVDYGAGLCDYLATMGYNGATQDLYLY
ncbi:MAG TPA: hypothetical protein VNB90_03180 [Cytophagaceae bacterium]|nr:hypothetical protein [Cytophagaceae bacterium]